MIYCDLHAHLKRLCNYIDDEVDLGGGLIMRNFEFCSRVRFPESFSDPGPNLALPEIDGENSELLQIHTQLNMMDSHICDNQNFRYHVIYAGKEKKARDIIILFHGFNEKYWDKYLPWAAHLARKTGKAVVLFPIAFHMNRAPAFWSDKRQMHRASQERKKRYPHLIDSTLSNAAISTRLHNRPDRFIWSGLESYHDVIDFVEQIKRGEHPGIEAEAGIDFCSYSIGTFLGEIVLMTNKNGYFSRSKYATFCGGPVFNRLSPVSKFILDSESNVSLYSYLVEHLESHMRENERLNYLLSGAFEEGVNFRSLLNYKKELKYREDKFRGFSDRFYAVTLAEDEVVPAYEVINTLRGSRGDINIRVDVLDYSYPYRHEDPFPTNSKIAEAVDREFVRTFDMIAEFLA
ncbi:DUF6051 family protein [Desulfovibrio sp. OttesenSCG-928-C06]|nr:DUF6051 family protein [Desulfovibrio sp. OttesenSCG-928-C06]